MMENFKISPSENADRLDVLEAKLNIILLFTGGQFLGFVGIVIAVISQS